MLCRSRIAAEADPAVLQQMADTVLQLLDALLANLNAKVTHNPHATLIIHMVLEVLIALFNNLVLHSWSCTILVLQVCLC